MYRVRLKSNYFINAVTIKAVEELKIGITMNSRNLEVAINASQMAMVLLKKNFANKNRASEKAFYDDIVSKVDIDSDKIITDYLSSQTPSYNILSEESGFKNNNSEFTWVIDSLDGSANYVNQIPYFGCSIGLASNKLPILGVICDPMNNNMIYAEKGNGTYFNGKKIRMNDIELQKSILGFDYGRTQKDEMSEIIKELVKLSRYVRVAGSSVLGFRDVAINRTQAYIHNNLKPWDACAGSIIVSEAGGVVKNFKKQNWSLEDKDVIASNNIIFDEIFDQITPAK